MSRSPVSEALIRLAGKGSGGHLAELVDHRGADRRSQPSANVETLDVAQRLDNRLAAELRTDADLVAIARRQGGFRKAVKQEDWLHVFHADMPFLQGHCPDGHDPFTACFREPLPSRGGGWCICISRSWNEPATAIL